MVLFPLKALEEEGWKIAAALTARHIGGAVNYMVGWLIDWWFPPRFTSTSTSLSTLDAGLDKIALQPS
jgi:hypothetical protein